MEKISISRILQEYFLDFGRNFRKLNYLCLNMLCIFPAVSSNYADSGWQTLFFVIPVMLCALSVGTHLQIYPNMFYLLPMSEKQREVYGKQALAIRVLIPSSLSFLWTVFLAGAAGVSGFEISVLTAGCLLGCFLMHSAEVTEKNAENSLIFAGGMFTIMLLPVLSLGILEDPWMLTAAVGILVFAVVAACKMWKRFCLECGRRKNFEGIQREKAGA